MALSARIPGAPDLVSLCRHKLEGIFDMHGVKTGSRTDIPGFLEKLHNDRYFAMDFWALVESLEGTRDRISAEQIRRTVAECVCRWVPKGDPALAGIEEEFDARVARRDGGIPSGPRVQPADEAGLRIIEHNTESMAAGTDRTADENIAASELERRDSHRELPVVELGSGTGSGAAARIDQILTRLELNDHELKLLLESIESRISRLEPHVEELTSQVVKSRHQEANAESNGGVKKDRWAGTTIATAWFGRRQAAVKNGAAATGVLASREMESADLRFATMTKSTATAAAEFDGAIAKALKPLPSKPALRRARRLAMLRVSRAQMALSSLGSQMMRSLGRGVVKGTAIAAETVAAARSFERKLSLETAPEMLWLNRRHAMLNNVAKGLGVGACLWLMIWLWGRPQADFAKAAPAAVSTAAASPVTQEKPADARAADDASTGARAGSVERTADVSADSVADGAAARDSTGGIKRVASQVTASKGRDYTAPPWTKWYSAADMTESQGASGRPAKKSAGR
jgi:hypothetical protein